VAEELAASTEDTVYLMLRSYDDVLCAWRAQGAYPIKANVVALGDRRPMGASVAGLCLLASLPEAESDTLIAANGPTCRRFAA
jgi:DNA-binding IclR family transcriptional regulator